MKERPILFSGPMVRAILDGRKTMTRRIVKPKPVGKQRVWEGLAHVTIGMNPSDDGAVWYVADGINPGIEIRCPYGVVGDKLAVKEAAWMWCERRPNGVTDGRPKWRYMPMREAPIHYQADHPKKPTIGVVSPHTWNQWGWRLKVARFLPAWAVRTHLEITSVRVERLQDITEEDAKKEGATCPYRGEKCGGYHHDIATVTEPPECVCIDGYVPLFKTLWDSINGNWDANPWVWVVEFRRVEK